MKKLFSALLTVALMILVISTAFASEIRPFADDFFREATVSLNNEMQASFKATTSSDVEELKVISCVLQKKSRALWIKDTDLVAPSTIANNTKYYRASKDYSDDCSPDNTYRIKAVFDADGHQITRYSNEVSY